MLRNYVDKVRRYFTFSRKEWTGFWLTALVFALIASFSKWGETNFNAVEGLTNYLLALIIVGSSVFVHHAGQKLYAIKNGLVAEQRIWWYGLLFSLLFALISNGSWQVYLAAGVFIHQIALHRIGVLRPLPGVMDWAKVALAGPIANILYAGAVFTIQQSFNLFNPAFVEQLFTFNLLFAAYSLLPVPPLDGSRIFYASRLTYVFFFTAFLSYVFMIVFLNYYSYLISLFIGAVAWLVFYVMFERTW